MLYPPELQAHATLWPHDSNAVDDREQAHPPPQLGNPAGAWFFRSERDSWMGGIEAKQRPAHFESAFRPVRLPYFAVRLSVENKNEFLYIVLTQLGRNLILSEPDG